MAENIREEFQHRAQALRDRLSDPGFLNNKGLGNEVSIYTFCYDAALEPEARDPATRCISDAELGVLPYNIHAFNLYDTLLGICEERRILDKIPQQFQSSHLHAPIPARSARVCTHRLCSRTARTVSYSACAPGGSNCSGRHLAASETTEASQEAQ